MADKSIVLLAGKGESTNILYHSLSGRFPVKSVLLEDPVPPALFLKRRAKRLGWAKVAGQVCFQTGIQPLLRRAARDRMAEIRRRYSMDASPIPEDRIIRIGSANSPEARKLLSSLSPDLVVVNGTRILSDETITSLPAPFVNMHAGITPLYRGVHGGYWALAEGRRDACGVTVHLVDKGIDTGMVLGQTLIDPGPRDNFTTYPLLQLGEGVGILLRMLPSLLAGAELERKAPPEGPSRLWSHPTLVEYAVNRVRRGVR